MKLLEFTGQAASELKRLSGLRNLCVVTAPEKNLAAEMLNAVPGKQYVAVWHTWNQVHLLGVVSSRMAMAHPDDWAIVMSGTWQAKSI